MLPSDSMENEFITRRRLIIILVAVTVVVFIGLVWLIAKLQPWELLGVQNSTTTRDLPVMKDCAYPISYWKAHPELYPSQVVIGGTVYHERELEALIADDSLDTGQQLRAQLAVAFLNNLIGADQSMIEATIFDAYAWLVKHPIGSQVTKAEQEEGRQFLNILEAYNAGLGGVSPCDLISTTRKTVTPDYTGTMNASLATSQTGTPTVTGTRTVESTRTGTVSSATGTPTPTTTRLVIPSHSPTPTSPAGPTILPTTQAPTPTRTSTPTPTETLQPTSTATLPPTFTPTPTLPPPPDTDTPVPTLPLAYQP